MSEWIHTFSTKLQSAAAITESQPLSTLGSSLHAIFTAPAGADLLLHPAYVPVADVHGLPRILLLGDSISIGYTLPVRRALKGFANVHRPAANCGSTANGLEQLESWLGEGKWDAIHLNFGLHDCVRNGAGQVVPLDAYQSNLEAIFTRLAKTGARLAWASTTPVAGNVLCPDLSSDGQPLAYRESDVEQYNAAAAAVAKAFSAEIDPLDQCIWPRLQELQVPNDVHFTRAGYAELGRQVAGFLRGLLGA